MFCIAKLLEVQPSGWPQYSPPFVIQIAIALNQAREDLFFFWEAGLPAGISLLFTFTISPANNTVVGMCGMALPCSSLLHFNWSDTRAPEFIFKTNSTAMAQSVPRQALSAYFAVPPSANKRLPDAESRKKNQRPLARNKWWAHWDVMWIAP